MRLDRRGALLVLLALAAVGAVALAARGDQAGGRDPAFTLSPGTTRAAQWLAVSLLAVFVLAVLGLFVWSLLGDGPVRKPERRRRSLVGTIVALAVALLVATQLEELRRGLEIDSDAQSTWEEESPDEGAGAADDGGRPSPAGSLALAGLGVLVLAGVVTLMVRSRLREEGVLVLPPVDDERVLVPAGAPTDLTAAAATEPDPRQAVLLAFAAAEATLAGTPLARRPATSPREWLATVRADRRDVAVPLAELVARYEIARFSHHAVTSADRDAALDALRRLP